MADEIMGKRANGAGGGGDGSSGAGGPATRRSNLAAVISVCSQFRDHFDDLVAFAYRIFPFAGVRRAAALRVLADRLEALVQLMTDLIPVLRAEALDAEKGTKSVADDLGKNEPK